MTEPPVSHNEVLDLLPWYLNGTLAEPHRARLEVHLRDCLPCNAALREERKLRGLLRDQDVVPLGPSHGLNALLDRIDQRQRPARTAARFVPWIGYGLAACVGGGIVWLWLAVAPVDGAGNGEFATLSTTTAAATDTPAIDIIFAVTPLEAELQAFGREIGGRFVAGPSEVGRYSFALDGATVATVETLLEKLKRDPRVRFAGRSYAAASGGGTVTESPGEAR
jgi:hypothetical protein